MKGYATVLVDPDHLELLTEWAERLKNLEKAVEEHGEFSTRIEYRGWFGRTKHRFETDPASANAMLKASGLWFFYYVTDFNWGGSNVPRLEKYNACEHIQILINLCKASRGGMIQIDQDLAATFNHLFPEGQ